MEKTIEKLLLSVNESLRFYKRGGWIDARRTPTSGVNMVDTIEDFIDARFNNEIWGVPEFHAASDLLEGRLFSCHVEGVDEEKKRFKSATLTLIKPEDIEDPSEFLLGEIKNVHDILGGNVVKCNGSRKSVKFEIYDE